ncbi:MAG: hypothetical protein ACD_34C00606G0001 [uncultured bacterium]|nr:MAG: hypothetical protein ACD_34C00606G0001 [uncultured bacterium]HCS40172.1 carbohydrate kinase family protein [Anaerolineaceae bacterium]
MTSNKSEVVVVGNVGIDTNVFFYSDGPDFSIEANFTQNIDVLGQAGGYASRGYARLGASTAFIGCVGEDYSGEYIKRIFGQEKINTEGLFIDPEGTSRSINLMYKNGQRKNFYDGKNHMRLHAPMDVAMKVIEGARLVHFNIPNWARELLPVAKKSGAIIACDIQDVIDVKDPYRLDFVKMAGYLFFSSANHDDPAPLIDAYLQLNPALVIVSGMGVRGCALGTGNGIQYFPPVTLDLPVVDTNGAGDALAVGFLASHILDGRSLEESILRGQISARYKCAQKATSNCMITRDLLDHYQKESK